MPKVKIDSNLFERIKKGAQIAGYSSVDEFIVHVIEKELERIAAVDDDQQVADRLRGLGYLE